MKIQVHIERLILDGLPLEKRQGPLVQVAVERELTRLLTANGLAQEWQAGGAVPSMSVSDFRLANENHPNQIGQQIAWSVYGGMGKTR